MNLDMERLADENKQLRAMVADLNKEREDLKREIHSLTLEQLEEVDSDHLWKIQESIVSLNKTIAVSMEKFIEHSTACFQTVQANIVARILEATGQQAQEPKKDPTRTMHDTFKESEPTSNEELAS